MRPGGGKEKGSEYERLVGRTLSLWVSEGARADLFARNVLSGGSFTNAMKKESNEHGMPGDLAANHPLAFTFLSLFMVECKHYSSLGFEAFLFDKKMDASFLGKVWTKTRKEAHQATKSVKKHMRPMVVARQNRRPSIVLLDRDVADTMLACVSGRLAAPLHWSMPGNTSMFLLDELVGRVRADTFLERVERMRRDS